jgi:hypothetical protein
MMGGIQPSEAKRLTYWEFTRMRHEWNERHKSDDDEAGTEPPDEDFVRAAQAELIELGIAGKAVN